MELVGTGDAERRRLNWHPSSGTRRSRQRTLTILARSLEMLRYAVERGDPVIVALVEHLRELLLKAGSQGRMTPAVLMIVLHQFASAKLDTGDALRELMHQLMEQDGEAQTAVSLGEARDHFARSLCTTTSIPECQCSPAWH
ncbi:MAG: hypothetical protein KDJ47_19675 [Hyphomicrobiaceae bacterium]|nr:hypothetical protein [Hyphomicrobiaceae bacterium]